MPMQGIKSVSSILKNNWLGTNTGNILFQRAVARTVMTEDSSIVSAKFSKIFSDAQIDEINNTFDYVLLPLADAFRNDFMSELGVITNFISKLKIPCAIVGVGLSGQGFTVKSEPIIMKFVKTVLEHSAMIGVRGHATGYMLSKMGFVPERDFTVIGCPSMYMYGDNLPRPRLIDLTPNSYVACYNKPNVLPPLYDFVRNALSQFPNGVTISQALHEIQNLYLNHPFPSSVMDKPWFPSDYPIDVSHDMMTSGRILGVVDINSWLDFMRTRDFCFGVRIHGNVAGILAGIPAHVISNDMRIEELTAYHNIPFTHLEDINENTSIFDLYNNTDYSLLHQGHSDRFSHYLRFLELNGIPHVERAVLNSTNAPFDKAYGSKPYFGMIRPLSSVSHAERFRRMIEWQNA